MTQHVLKCDSVPFAAVKSGIKPFEFRKNDRCFEVGDILILMKHNNFEQIYSGDVVVKKVTYILEELLYGVPEGYCVMGLGDIE